MNPPRYLPLSLLLCGILSGVLASRADAYPKFAQKEKKACAYCHLNPGGGNGWGFRGLYYRGHSLSFVAFKEEIEAKRAGVKPNAVGLNAKPTKPYTGRPARK